jgi:hypothetical protein
VKAVQAVILPLLPVILIGSIGTIHAQEPKDPSGPPDLARPPLPPRDREETDLDREREGSTVAEEDTLPVSDAPWGLPPEMQEKLAAAAEVYRAYTRQFTCIETARSVHYKGGEAGEDKHRTYSFLLTTDESGSSFQESRRLVTEKGTVKKGEVKDEEPFPPAYAWVFLFSAFNQPYFSYRDLGDRFDGFDWVREIQFKGAVPFTDGKDIRQWEGVVLVDAATHTPLEIRAQPKGQEDRLRAKFLRWAQSFNIMGIRLAPRPFGYRCRIEFHFRKDRLTFPTRLRYDKFRAVEFRRVIPWKASSRTYSEYRFFQVGTRETLGDSRE